jgi:hypothetical protein
MAKQNQVERRKEFYNDLPQDRASSIKAAPKQKGILEEGFNKLEMPKDKSKQHLQIASERSRVGSKWPGPGKKPSKGKASPSSRESFLRQKNYPGNPK